MPPAPCGARFGSTGCHCARYGRANDSGSHRRRKARVPAERDAFEAARGVPFARRPAIPHASRFEVSARRRRTGIALAGLTAMVLSGAAFCAPAVPSEAASPPGTLVRVGLHRLHIHCTGRGSPTVVFESGLGGTSLDWVRVQPEVSRFTRACSYDRAGYGWSEARPRAPPRGPDRRRAGQASPARERTASLPAGRSLPRGPRRSSAGCAQGAPGGGGTRPRRLDPRAPVPADGIGGGTSADRADRSAVRDLQPRAGAQRPARQPEAPGATPRAGAQGDSDALWRAWIVSAQRPAGRLDSPSPDAPVIVLARSPRRGAGDNRDRLDRTWLDLQRELAGTMKNGSFQVVSGTGHYIHLERPERVVGAIRTIIDRHRYDQAGAADPR